MFHKYSLLTFFASPIKRGLAFFLQAYFSCNFPALKIYLPETLFLNLLLLFLTVNETFSIQICIRQKILYRTPIENPTIFVCHKRYIFDIMFINDNLVNPNMTRTMHVKM